MLCLCLHMLALTLSGCRFCRVATWLFYRIREATDTMRRQEQAPVWFNACFDDVLLDFDVVLQWLWWFQCIKTHTTS